MALPLCAQHGSSVNPFTSPEHREAGASLFRARCAGCHGPSGAGTGAGPSLVSGAYVHGGTDSALFTTISKGLPGTSMPAFSLNGLETWELVTHIRAIAAARGGAQGKGDAKAGAAVFRESCAKCHLAGGEGSLNGPDLTNVAGSRSYNELRESIRNPDAQVESDHWRVIATTSGGETIRGARLNEDTFSIQLRDETGRLLSLHKPDLKQLEIVRNSPMPSFAGKLTEERIDDVIAWLLTLGSRP